MKYTLYHDVNDPRYYDKMNGGQNDKNEDRPALDRAPQIFKVDCIFVLPFVRHLKKKKTTWGGGWDDEDGEDEREYERMG